jgi:hypothetical protein
LDHEWTNKWTLPSSGRSHKSDNATYGCETELTVERITTTKTYAPILLSHFFSGVKETNPLKAYLAYYNILEYYFEEAPALLSKNARTELEQLKCVMELLTTEAGVAAKLTSIDPDMRFAIASPLLPSVGPAILGVDSAQPSLRGEFTRWLYEIRCAVVHSKKTRRGSPASGFEPYTATAKSVSVGIEIVRWLAILCIEKDHDLANSSHPCWDRYSSGPNRNNSWTRTGTVFIFRPAFVPFAVASGRISTDMSPSRQRLIGHCWRVYRDESGGITSALALASTSPLGANLLTPNSLRRAAGLGVLKGDVWSHRPDGICTPVTMT